jgi:uncharacterized protein
MQSVLLYQPGNDARIASKGQNGMSGETDLNVLMQSMSAQLQEGVYVFATLSDRTAPVALPTLMRFEEAEGSTLILLREHAESHGIDFEFPCRMITLKVHSSLEAVGFIARVATALAAENMGVNPVSAFFHDHLFVPDGREKDALRILEQMSLDAVRAG